MTPGHRAAGHAGQPAERRTEPSASRARYGILMRVTTGGRPDSHRGEPSPASIVGARGTDHRVAALTLATLAFIGGLIGILNLMIDGVVRAGVDRWIYTGTMAGC